MSGAVLKHLKAVARGAKTRPDNTVLVHSCSILRDVVAFGGRLRTVCVGPRFPFAATPSTLSHLLGRSHDYGDVAIVQLDEHAYSVVSGVEQAAPGEVTAEVWRPPPFNGGLSELVRPADRGLLILDNVADPGNVGVLFRTAVCLGWRVARIGGCDPLNPKAVRAGRGVQLYTPFCNTSWSDLSTPRPGWSLFAGDLTGDPLGDVAAACRLPVVVVGNEARGVQAPRSAPLNRVRVDMAPDSPGSLNVAVAAGIVLNHFNSVLSR